MPSDDDRPITIIVDATSWQVSNEDFQAIADAAEDTTLSRGVVAAVLEQECERDD